MTIWRLFPPFTRDRRPGDGREVVAEHRPLPAGIEARDPPANYGAPLAPLPNALCHFTPDHLLLDLPFGGTIGFFQANRVSRQFMVAGFCDLRVDLNGVPLGLRYADIGARLGRVPHPDWVDGYTDGLVRDSDLVLWTFWGYRLTLSHGFEARALDFAR